MSFMARLLTSLTIVTIVAFIDVAAVEVTSDINGMIVNDTPESNQIEQLEISKLSKKIANMNNIELLVVLWTSPWCDVCSKMMPMLQEVSSLVHSHPINFVVCDPSDLSDPTASHYRSEYGIENYPHITIFRDDNGITYDDDMSPAGLAAQLTQMLHKDNTGFLAPNSTVSPIDSNTLAVFNKQLSANPIAVIVITNGSTTEWPLDDNMDKSLSGCQLIVLDATSEHCETILFTAPNRPRWKVRHLNDHATNENAVYGPRCLKSRNQKASLSSLQADHTQLYPQAWVLHWKDPTLIAPLDWIMNYIVQGTKLQPGDGLRHYEVNSENVNLAMVYLVGMDNSYTR
jgi:thiol-disulfide isomerase/thioredoxin